MLKRMAVAGVVVTLVIAVATLANWALAADGPAAAMPPAKMAWGQEVNGLKAALVPLGGGVTKGWQKDFICPSCPVEFDRNLLGKCSACGATTVSTVYTLCESCAADQRVCQACGAVKPAGASFVEGEPLRLELHFRNVGERAMSVDASPPRGWRIKVTTKDAAKGDTAVWEAREMAPDYSKPRTIPKGLGTGWALDNIRFMEWVEADLMFITDGGTGVTRAYTTREGRKEVPIRQNLPPGKYSVVALFAFNPPPPPPPSPAPKPAPAADAPAAGPIDAEAVVGWTGRVETAAVEIEVRPKGAAVKPAKEEPEARVDPKTVFVNNALTAIAAAEKALAEGNKEVATAELAKAMTALEALQKTMLRDGLRENMEFKSLDGDANPAGDANVPPNVKRRGQPYEPETESRYATPQNAPQPGEDLLYRAAAFFTPDHHTTIHVHRSYVARTLRLASLAPDIVEMILAGNEPSGLRRLSAP